MRLSQAIKDFLQDGGYTAPGGIVFFLGCKIFAFPWKLDVSYTWIYVFVINWMFIAYIRRHMYAEKVKKLV